MPFVVRVDVAAHMINGRFSQLCGPWATQAFRGSEGGGGGVFGVGSCVLCRFSRQAAYFQNQNCATGDVSFDLSAACLLSRRPLLPL